MKIIGVGWGRTGTTSLQKALNILGYKCFHGCSVLQAKNKSEHIDFFLKAVQLKKEDKAKEINFIEYFKDYDAGVDMNIAYFYKELITLYPDSKVILTIRDFDSWYDSFYNTLYVNDLKTIKEKGITQEIEMFNSLYYNTTFEGRFEDREYMKILYLKHIEDIKSIIPKERLLVYDLSNWEDLCEFLGKEIPDVEFPVENTHQDMIDFISNRKSEDSDL